MSCETQTFFGIILSMIVLICSAVLCFMFLISENINSFIWSFIFCVLCIIHTYILICIYKRKEINRTFVTSIKIVCVILVCFCLPSITLYIIISFVTEKASTVQESLLTSAFFCFITAFISLVVYFICDYYMSTSHVNYIELEESKPVAEQFSVTEELEKTTSSVLPELVGGVSHLLKEDHIRQISRYVPPIAVGSRWVSLFCTWSHGFSLRTLYTKLGLTDTPVLLVIQDNKYRLFGVITSSSLSTELVTFDVHDSLLFDFVEGFHVYQLKDAATYMIVATYKELGFGCREKACKTNPASGVTIQQALYPIIIVLKVFGIMPFTLTSQNLKLITSNFNLIISVSYSLVSVFTATFVLASVMKHASLSVPSLAEVNNTETELSFEIKQIVYMNKLDCFISYVIHITSSYVCLFVLRLQLPYFCSKINILDNFINMIVSNHINLKQRQISIIATVFVLLSCFASYLYNVIFAVKEDSLLFTCISIILSCATTQSFCCEVLFASCCFSLRTRLQVLNKTLYEYFYCPLRNIPENGIAYIKLFKNEEKKQNEKLLLLELIRKSRWRLCGLVDDLNSMFQMQLLVSLSYLFVQITTTMYVVLWQPLFAFQRNIYSVKCIWCLIFIGRFVLCVTTASTTVDEAHMTKAVLGDIISSNRDSELQEELIMFYTDVTARSIGFSVYGLLEVRTNLIAKYAGCIMCWWNDMLLFICCQHRWSIVSPVAVLCVSKYGYVSTNKGFQVAVAAASTYLVILIQMA